MGHLILHLVVLYTAACFCPLKSQEHNVDPLTFLNVSQNLDLQELLLEWDVSDEAYNSEKEVLFNIQINQTGADDVVWNENYTTILNKSNRPIQWRWVSKAPLECMSYEIRIRRLVTSESTQGSEVWSNWSKSKTINGMDIEDSKAYALPKDKIVEEGSNVTFCCIAKKGEMISLLHFENRSYPASRSQRRMAFTVEKVPLSKPGGILVICGGSPQSTVIFVTRPPGYPKDLSCETEDMVTLNCTWKPGSEDNLVGSRSITFLLSDTSKGKIDCQEPSSKNSCLFKMGTQTSYNLSLTARNNLGKKQTDLIFDAAQRVHPVAPYHLSVSDHNATAVKLRWKMKHKLELLCQIESRHLDGNVDLHHSMSHSFTMYHIVSGLQPYTVYTFRVRCGASRHFWKWSEWSTLTTARTKESAPSGSLDIWRNIGPGLGSCNVTVFWKPSPGFCANGEIRTYGISYEMLGEPAVSREVPASNNSTMIFLRNCSCKISVSAKNSVNSSPSSVMVISAASENDHIREKKTSTFKEDIINNTETGIYIPWKPQSQFDGYIIDWCNHPRVQPCDFQWKKFGQNQSSALISSDAFTPGVQYSFRVYGSLGNSAYLLEKKAKYLKELEPDSIPELDIAKLTSRMLILTWDYNHLNESHPGFIRGYSVFVKAKQGNCTLEGSELTVVQDGSVICKYTIEEPTKKRLTVKNPGVNQEYWLQVLAFSTSPPNIMDSFLEGTSHHLRKVTIPPDGSWAFQLLLLLVVFPLMLLMCFCFWRSDRVKNCCCPKIPHPTVTAIKVLQTNPKTSLAASDLTPDNIIVDVCKSQPWGCEKKQYYNQGLCAETPAVETVFQNMTYFTEDANCYLSLHTQGVGRQKPNLASATYKALSCFTLPNNLTNLNYVSQMDVALPGVQQGNLVGLVEPKHRSDYKPQQV